MQEIENLVSGARICSNYWRNTRKKTFRQSVQKHSREKGSAVKRKTVAKHYALIRKRKKPQEKQLRIFLRYLQTQ